MNMKKLLALIVAGLMLFSLSFAVAEDTFEDNLKTFLSGLNPDEEDVLLTVDAAGQSIVLRLGTDAAGVHGSAELAGTPVGEAMITSDAAYVTAMGQGLKVQYATVANFAKSMASQLFGELNLSMEQLQQDAQMLVMKVFPYMESFVKAVATEEVENGTKMTVNGEALADAVTGTFGGLLADEEVKACLDRYLPFLKSAGIEVTASDLQNQWDTSAEQIKQVLASSETFLTMYNDNTYDFEMLFANGSDSKAGIISKGTVAENVDTLTTIGTVGEEPEVTFVFKAQDNTIVYDMKSEEISMNEQIIMDGDQIKSIDYVLTSEGSPMVEMHYSEGHLVISGDGLSMVGEVTVKEPKHLEALLTMTQGSDVQIMNITVDIQDDALVCTMAVGEEKVVATLAAAEKTEWNDLSQNEGMMEITEEMLSTMIPSLLGN